VTIAHAAIRMSKPSAVMAGHYKGEQTSENTEQTSEN
jgi:hypothetical protein